MRCLYDVLGVSNDVDDTQLKKAYRQAALQWHPDKNQDRQQEAEVRFKEIQNAYEILSDKHERAWYDSHRAQILRAGSNYQAGGGGFTSDQAAPPEDLSLYQYFSSSCYDGFNDAPKGFYTVYRDVFDGLFKHETEAAERTGKKGPSPVGFGRSDSPWSEVSAFYQYWLQFVSDREFAWADVHNLASAPNRKVRRLMDEDNKKMRRAARREFQENVRSLVAFVRKRDRRVAAWQHQEELKKQERLAAEERRKEEERQQRIQRALEYQDAAWVDAGADDEDSHEEDLALEEDELYCVACDKFFKTPNAMANHERSKKHLERADALRAAMQEEEDALSAITESDAEGKQSTAASDDEQPSSGQEEQEGTMHASGLHTANEDPGNGVPATSSSHQPNTNGKVDSLEQILADLDSSSQQDSSGTEEVDVTGSGEASEDESEASEESLDEDAMLARMVQAHASVSKPKRRAYRQDPEQDSGAADSREAAASGPPEPAKTSTEGPDQAASLIAEPDDGPSSPAQSTSAVAGEAPHEQPDHGNGGTTRKPKSKKDKRKAKEAAAMQSGLMCSVCRASFGTRNQLFKHIAERGHAQLK
ncbi:DnaJ homolog subfamily C member 21 at N-terminal half [Coccomyxa sp. Obi]|nr:DnaJ homolog subfamily C member 21 at N-terminal half [Coccomyxa sp. Obi]